MKKTSPVGGEKSTPTTHPKDPGGTQTYLPKLDNKGRPISGVPQSEQNRIIGAS